MEHIPDRSQGALSLPALRSSCTWIACLVLLAAIALPTRSLPATALACAAAIAVASGPWTLSRLDVAACAMALAYVLSAMLSPFQTSAGPMLACTAVVCGIARTPRPMACVLLGSVIVLGAFTLTLVAGLGLSGFEAARFAGSTMLQEWGGYPELGLLGLLVLPPVVSLGLHSRRLSASLAIVVLGSVIAAGLFFTFSRAAWVVAAVTTGLVVVVWQRRTALVAAVGAAVLAAMLLWAMFLPRLRPPAPAPWR